jgi:hypothetical protein
VNGIPGYGQYSTLPGEPLSLNGADGYTAASATLTLGGDPSAVVTAQAAVGQGADVGAQAHVYYTYQFIVSGPVNASVPVNVNATLAATESGSGPYAVAGASIYVEDTKTGMAAAGWAAQGVCAAVGTSCQFGGSDVISQTIYVPTDDAINVFLNANVSTTDYLAGTSLFATASVDPTFTIDPTFLTTNPGYALAYGPGVLAAPEPDAWALMIVGLGLVGLTVRQRPRRIAV